MISYNRVRCEYPKSSLGTEIVLGAYIFKSKSIDIYQMLDFDLALFLVDMDIKGASLTTILNLLFIRKRKNKVTPPQSL